jgi:hypothetical protein
MKVYVVIQTDSGHKWDNIMSIHTGGVEAHLKAIELSGLGEIESSYNFLHRMSDYIVQEHELLGEYSDE